MKVPINLLPETGNTRLSQIISNQEADSPLFGIGYLRLNQIIGQDAVSPDEARHNKDRAEALRKKFPNAPGDPEQKKLLARELAKIGGRTPQPAITPIIPVCKTTWWGGVKSGRYPAPVKLSERCTAWRVEDIRELVSKSSSTMAERSEKLNV